MSKREQVERDAADVLCPDFTSFPRHLMTALRDAGFEIVRISPKRTHRLEYGIWLQMRQRCNNTKNVSYPAYGGVGIKVHPSWDSFHQFIADVGPRPSLGHSLDRINGKKGYEPGNCRWATAQQQAENKPATKLTPDKVRDIIARLKRGESMQSVADVYGIAKSAINSVKVGKTWWAVTGIAYLGHVGGYHSRKRRRAAYQQERNK